MSNEKDQKLNLPKTSIPMKANLNQREPEFLKEWDKRNVYKKIRKNKKNSIYNPLSGSLAKVCIEFSIPDRTKKVPQIPNVNVIIERITVQECNIDLFSKTKIQ